jgi:hypothetical protein
MLSSKHQNVKISKHMNLAKATISPIYPIDAESDGYLPVKN